MRRRLGYLPQDPGFHPDFTAFEFVDYVAILKELTDRRARHAEARRVLDAVGLAEVRGKRIRRLSGGMRQRRGAGARRWSATRGSWSWTSRRSGSTPNSACGSGS